MPQHPLFDYDRWTALLDQNALMASAAEFHGLIVGMLAAGVPADPTVILPVIHDFLNDGQALNNTLKTEVVPLIELSQKQLADEEFAFMPLLPGDEEMLTERLEALVDWAQAFLVGFATRQHDLALLGDDMREVIEQMTEITRIDVYGEDEDSSEADNEESYFLVLEHLRMLALQTYTDVGLKFAGTAPAAKTLH